MATHRGGARSPAQILQSQRLGELGRDPINYQLSDRVEREGRYRVSRALRRRWTRHHEREMQEPR